jgi:hypothetical protein
MHAVVILIFIAVSIGEYIASLSSAASGLKLLPEFLSVAVAAYVLLEGLRRGFGSIAPKYLLTFAAVAAILVCGVLTNGVGSGPILAGLRYYGRALPLFFLPAVCQFTDQQKRTQLRVLLALGLAQVPLAAYQRWIVWSEERFTGDTVSGTLLSSGTLSLALVCMMLVAMGLWLSRRIGRTTFALLFFTLLLPTAINETKATVLFLPAGLLTVLIAGSPPGRRVRAALSAVTLLGIFAAGFVPVYDYLERTNPYKVELVDFFSDQAKMQKYLTVKHAGIGVMKEVGRVDALRIPSEYTSGDPLRFAFGLGMGNASRSNLGESFTGEYYPLFQSFTVMMSYSVFILELGALGTGLVFLLHWFLLTDSFAVARGDSGLTGAIAIGWTGVVVVMAMATFYITTHVFSSLSYLFWYFSGMIATRRAQLVATERRLAA